MKLTFSLFAWICFGAFALQAQDTVATRYARMITQSDLKQNLSILASDALEGRETGKRGQKMAAAFISAHFQELGLGAPVAGSHYQPVELYTSLPGNIYVKAGQNQYVNFEDVVYYGSQDSGSEVTLPIVFAGKGKAEDYAELDVKDKAVAVAVNSDENFRAPLDIAREKGAKM